MSSYIDFECKFNEENGMGLYEEVEYPDSGGKKYLRSFQFKKINDSISIMGIEITNYCAEFYYDMSVEIPEEIMGLPVVSIAQSASGMTSSDVCITSVKFPKTLKYIDDCAFLDMCEFDEVEIPKTVERIGEHAFGYMCYLDADKNEVYEKLEDFVIVCAPGSAAEEYAKQNGFETKPLAE